MKNNTTKLCPTCEGKGRVNFRWVEEWHNTDWIPTKGEMVKVQKSDKCTACDGTGELELNWTPKQKQR